MNKLVGARWIVLLGTVLLALSFLTSPAAGQGPIVSVSTVQPKTIAGPGPVTLTITGSGFVTGTVVTLGGTTELQTTFVEDTVLHALWEGPVTAGNYGIMVTNPNGTTASLPNALAVFGPTSVQPNRVSNATEVQLVVTGVAFADGASVIVDGYGALITTFVSESMLRATLPPNVAPGVYDVRVVNPDAAFSVLQDALTVTAGAVTPEPTNTPPPTPFMRPVMVVQSYGASAPLITPGDNLDFEITLANAGQATASNIVATFVSGDFVPRATGGVRAVGTLTPAQSSRFWQPLSASPELKGKSTAVLEVQVAYTDVAGTAYSDSFSLTFPVVPTPSGGSGTAPTPTPTPTPSPTPQLRPQLLVTSYETDVETLAPGSRFTLSLDVQNQGNADARRISLIVGGGGANNGGGSVDGTPQPGGGTSGAGGEFSTFAPLGTSNVSYLGDLPEGDGLQASLGLIVNAATKPGAYPIVISFVYNNPGGGNFVDEQVITLLVYDRPLVDMNFYTEPAPLFAGQPGPLPLQAVNVGRASAVFGNFSVTGEGGQFSNNNIFVGTLEPGGYFPLDAVVIPEQPGVIELTLALAYTDDFNQPQVITKTIALDVLEAPPVEEPPPDNGPGGEPGRPPAEGSETWRAKVWRFILGIIGLSSGPALNQPPMSGPGGPVDGPVDGPIDGPVDGPVDGPIDGPVDGPGGMPIDR